MINEKPPTYQEHKGTIRVAGHTTPKTAGFCAFKYLTQGIENIDFFYIGANAGHQATKAMGVFSYLVDSHFKGSYSVTFKPERVMTLTSTDDQGGEKEKDATIWKTYIHKHE